MYFNDLNHQDYIIDVMRETAVEAWEDPQHGHYVKNNNADPRLDGNVHMSEGWKHRGQWFATHADGQSTMGSLASWGVKNGDVSYTHLRAHNTRHDLV